MRDLVKILLIAAALFAVLFLAVVAARAQAPPVHQATLTWAMSADQVADPSLSITYSGYRINGPCAADGTFAFASATKLFSASTALTYVDPNVKVAQTYCYSVTAVLNGMESGAQPAAGTIPLARIQVTVGTK